MDEADGGFEIVCGPGTQIHWVLHVEIRGGSESTPSAMIVPSMLEVEQVITARLTEHAHDAFRVVHTSTTREIHLRDGSSIVFTWEPQVSDWRCKDCGIDTDAIAEYYMLHDPLWQRAAAEDAAGHLCIACLEARLGRTLTAADFTGDLVNTAEHLPRSPRLTARIHAP